MPGNGKSRRQQSDGQRTSQYRSQKQQTQRDGKYGNRKSQARKKRIHKVDAQSPQEESTDGSTTEYEDTMVFHAIDTEGSKVKYNASQTEAFATIEIACPKKKGQHELLLKVDTGASGNTLPLRILKDMYGDKWQSMTKPTSVQLSAYNGTSITCLGTIDITCKYKRSKWTAQTFYVVDVKGLAVLGLPGCNAMAVITIHEMHNSLTTVEDLKREYPGQFDTIGNFHGKTTLHVKEDAKPTIDPPRKCSIHLKQKIKAELDDMQHKGIIRKVEHHTDWCSSMTTVVKKDGSLRLCLDPKRLNDAMKICPHKTPTLEEINPTFAGAQFFSKLDAKAGYWSVHLTEKSQELTTFRTPFGRYCFQRLPFGLCVSQDIFQQHMDRIIDDLPGCVCIADDIAVVGKTEEDLECPDKVWATIEAQLKVNINFRIHRLELMRYRQRQDENIDEFVTRCRDKARDCDFSASELQDRIMELVIATTSCEPLQRTLLEQPKGFSIDKLLHEGRKYEALAAGQKSLQMMDTRLPLKVPLGLQTQGHFQQGCRGDHEWGLQPIRSTRRNNVRQWTTVHRTTVQGHVPEMVHHSQDFVSTLPQVKRTGRTDGLDGQIPPQEVCYDQSRPTDCNASSPRHTSRLAHEVPSGNPLWATDPHYHIPSHHLAREQSTTEHLLHRQTEMKETHDKHAGKELPPLHVGQPVRVLHPREHTWIPAKVSRVCKEPRSYEISTPNGAVLWRNRSHLREIPVSNAPISKPDIARPIRFADTPQKHTSGNATPNTPPSPSTPNSHNTQPPSAPNSHNTQSPSRLNSHKTNTHPKHMTTRSGRLIRKPIRLQTSGP